MAVIGSGPCAAMAAHQLAARDIDVTMLESGTRRPPGLVVRAGGNTLFRHVRKGYMRDVGFATSLDPSTHWYASLSHGGLSNHWTGAVPRFHPSDFTEGARLDERYRWPIEYAELVPFYELVEPILEVTSDGRPAYNLPPNVVRYTSKLPKDWAAAARRLHSAGRSLVPIPLANGSPWMIAGTATGFNSFVRIVLPLLAKPNFSLRSGVHVSSLVWSSPEQRVVAVEYIERDSRQIRALPVDAVVVAAGALHSTRILMSSTSDDFPVGLGNSSGVLGRYLHDHPRDWYQFETTRPMTLPTHPLYLTREDYDRSPPLLAASCTIGLATPSGRIGAFARRKGTRFGVQVFGTVVPQEAGRVALSKSEVDEFGLPRLDIWYAYDDESRQNMVDARARFACAFDEIGNPITGTTDFARLEPGSSVHWGGTVRMHSSPEFGVLDGWNRIHDAHNVVVCDASSFTTGPEKNPTLTAMAIAARAAAHLGDALAGNGSVQTEPNSATPTPF